MWSIATHPDSQSCTLAPGHRYYHIQYCIICESEVVGKIDEEELKSTTMKNFCTQGHINTYSIMMADLQASLSSLLPFWIPKCRAFRRKVLNDNMRAKISIRMTKSCEYLTRNEIEKRNIAFVAK